jgi:thiol-disulfide isomerase/thioredoxin
MTEPAPSARKNRGLQRAVSVVGGILLATLVIGLYEIARPGGKATAFAGACPLSQAAATKADPLVHGEVAALTLADHDNKLADIAFNGPDGARTTVGAFKGKILLLNLWATWCVPCRQEMPALAKLQANLGSNDFSVVAINIDTTRLDRPKAFLREIGATSLPYYADNTADILQALKQSEKIIGLPTTILIGKDGCEIGTMAGPAAWDSPDAETLIKRVEG